MIWGSKQKGDEGFVDYGSKSGQVVSNMSQLDQDKYGPILELEQAFYGIGDSDAPLDWRLNYADGGWIPFETDENGVDLTPPSAEGSPYHEMMDKLKESEEERESYWSNEDGIGENAIENREDYKEYEKGWEEFLNYHKKIIRHLHYFLLDTKNDQL